MTALLLLAALGVGSPVDPACREALGALYGGSTERALEELARLADASPGDPIPAYLEALALAWRIEQQPDDHGHDKAFGAWVARAVATANSRIEADPEDARAYLARGAAHGVRSRLALFRGAHGEGAREAVAMRRDLLVVRRVDPGNKDALFGLGLYDYYVDVLPKLEGLLRILAGMPAGNRARGLALMEEARDGSLFHHDEVVSRLYEIDAFLENRPDRALEEARDLRERHPSSPLWAFRLAEHLRERLGLYAESARVAREIRAASEAGRPNYAPIVAPMAQVLLGDALLRDLRFAEARSELLGVQGGVNGAEWVGSRAQVLLGRALELSGDRAGALDHYRIAATSRDLTERRRAQAALASPLSPSEAAARRLLAEARRLYEAGRPSESEPLFRKASALWPRSEEAALRVAEAEIAAGRPQEAREALERLAGVKSPDPPWVRPWSRLLLARVQDLTGHRDAAVRLYKEVCDAPLGQEPLRALATAGVRAPYASRPVPGDAPARANHSN